MKRLALAACAAIACQSQGLVAVDEPAPSACRGASRLVDGMCAPADLFWVLLARTRLGNEATLARGVAACFGEAGRFRPVEPIASDGPCRLFGAGAAIGNGPFPRADAGRITVHGGHPSPFTLTPATDKPCYDFEIDPGHPPFDPGAVLEISAAGGPDLPSFATRLSAPADVVIKTVELRRDSPLIEWQPGNPAREVTVRLGVVANLQASRILCDVRDTGAFMLPSSLVSQLPKSGLATVEIERRRVAHLEPMASDKAIEAQVTSSAERELPQR